MTELQLLVIDLGDACVVKVEKGGQVVINSLPLPSVAIYQEHEPKVVTTTFDELRKAIDGVKPVPRIERELMANTYERYYVHFYDTQYPLPLNAYDALSQLVGKPLPIYEGGKWTDLMPKNGVGWELPINVWRYTR